MFSRKLKGDATSEDPATYEQTKPLLSCQEIENVSDFETTMKVSKCPTDDLAVTNCAIVNREDFDATKVKHVEIQTGPAHRFVFSIKNHPNVALGEIAFATPQRAWATLSLGQEVRVTPYTFSSSDYIATITLQVDFRQKKAMISEPLNSDEMAREFSMQFAGQAFTVGQTFVFSFVVPKLDKIVLLSVVVKEMQGTDLGALTSGSAKPGSVEKIVLGSLLANAPIIFEKAEGSQMNLIGKSKGKSAYRALINPDWDFQKMGIGGMDNEFSAIFRRAFSSRLFPPDCIEQLGMKHVRGILLYGPPGTGKTLIARQIGKMLNAREPKIVNGPEILNKYVGESEGNIRKLFADAEEEWKRCGSNSALHMIIFDEIDAICKQRGSMAGSSGVHDTVVNQLLSKMDGVEQLNNILVIGMTNRRDMIDEALLRPGRMEVQMEISLPDEAGRMQILKIHTERMREYGKLDPSVDIAKIAKQTPNFSGAEIEGLVRAAQSSAMNRMVKTGSSVHVDPDAFEKLKVTSGDFDYAIENDVKPAFGHVDDNLDRFQMTGFYWWSTEIGRICESAELFITSLKKENAVPLQSVLFMGSVGCGTSSIACKLAKESNIPFVRLCSPADLAGYSETAKCAAIRKIFHDAYKSPTSIVVVDDLEGLLDYTAVGPRFSQLILGTLTQLLKLRPPNNHRLLVLATSSNKAFVDLFNFKSLFSESFDVPAITTVDQILTVAEESNVFSDEELPMFNQKLRESNQQYYVGIKRLMNYLRMSENVAAGMNVDYVVDQLKKECTGGPPTERNNFMY